MCDGYQIGHARAKKRRRLPDNRRRVVTRRIVRSGDKGSNSLSAAASLRRAKCLRAKKKENGGTERGITDVNSVANIFQKHQKPLDFNNRFVSGSILWLLL